MSEPKKRSMVIAIINNMPFYQAAFTESLIPLLFETAKTTSMGIMNVKAFPVDFARNWAVKRFLEHPEYKECEWMGWLDIDMTFPREMFDKLITACEETGAKVMTGVYFKRNFNNEIVAWRTMGAQQIEPILDGSIQEVEIMGMGCVVIHRSVLEKVGYPWFKYGALHENLEILSTEDVQFCTRCKEIGEKIMIHTGVICGHILTVENHQSELQITSLSHPGDTKGTLQTL